MENGEGPDLFAVPPLVAIDAGRSHAGVAGKVVGNHSVLFEPLSNPFGMISQRRRVFGDAAWPHRFDRLFIQLQILPERIRIGFGKMFPEIVVNPSAVAAYFIAALAKEAHPGLR